MKVWMLTSYDFRTNDLEIIGVFARELTAKIRRREMELANPDVDLNFQIEEFEVEG